MSLATSDRPGTVIEDRDLQPGDKVTIWTNGNSDYTTNITYQETKWLGPAEPVLIFRDSDLAVSMHPCINHEIRLIERKGDQ